MNLNTIVVTGKSKLALAVSALVEAFPNKSLEMSDTLHSALSALAVDKKPNMLPDASEVSCVSELVHGLDAENYRDHFSVDLELALTGEAPDDSSKQPDKSAAPTPSPAPTV